MQLFIKIWMHPCMKRRWMKSIFEVEAAVTWPLCPKIFYCQWLEKLQLQSLVMKFAKLSTTKAIIKRGHEKVKCKVQNKISSKNKKSYTAAQHQRESSLLYQSSQHCWEPDKAAQQRALQKSNARREDPSGNGWRPGLCPRWVLPPVSSSTAVKTSYPKVMG